MPVRIKERIKPCKALYISYPYTRNKKMLNKTKKENKYKEIRLLEAQNKAINLKLAKLKKQKQDQEEQERLRKLPQYTRN